MGIKEHLNTPYGTFLYMIKDAIANLFLYTESGSSQNASGISISQKSQRQQPRKFPSKRF